MLTRNDRVIYRSFVGDPYDAIVVKVRSETRVDLDVMIPGIREPRRFDHILAERCERKEQAA